MKKVATPLALLLASVALVACGSSSSSSSSSTASPATTNSGAAVRSKGKTASSGEVSQTLKVEANPNGQLSYLPNQLSAKAGNVTIDFKNPQGLSHDIAVEDPGGKLIGKSELISESATTLSLSNLTPGTYHYYCTVPGHREAGMEGTLLIK